MTLARRADTLRGPLFIHMQLQALTDGQLRSAFLLARKDFNHFAEGICLPGAATAMAKLDMVLDEYNRRRT